MSFSCTLHPVDPRIFRELRHSLKGERCDWEFLVRLRNQKQRINRVNQPFKRWIGERFATTSEFIPELHLWGRPFFFGSDEPAEINGGIARLYSYEKESKLVDFYQQQLQQFLGEAQLKLPKFRPEPEKIPELGLERVLEQLRIALKSRRNRELALDLGFVTAQLAAVAYPYWYLGQYTLSFLRDLPFPGWEKEPFGIKTVFSDFSTVLPYIPSSLERNLTAGIYLEPSEVADFAAKLATAETVLLNRMTQKQLTRQAAFTLWQKIREALAYAQEYHFGVLEASDIYEGQYPFP